MSPRPIFKTIEQWQRWYNRQLLLLLNSARRVAKTDSVGTGRGKNEPASGSRLSGAVRLAMAVFAVCFVGCKPAREFTFAESTNLIAINNLSSLTPNPAPVDSRIEMVFAPTTFHIHNGTAFSIGRIGTNELKPGMLLRVKPDKTLAIVRNAHDLDAGTASEVDQPPDYLVFKNCGYKKYYTYTTIEEADE